MALTATVLLDIGNQTQTLTYYLNGVQVDQLVYANNQVTFGSSPGFNLSQSDLGLYISSFNAFQNDLILNFPNSQNSARSSLPLSLFTMSNVFQGVTHVNYIQTSGSNSIYSINFVPIASSASFAIRSSQTITMQEFFMTCLMLNQYSVQIGVN